MTSPSDPLTLTMRLAVLSSISFGGFPTVLPDVRNFVVATHGWVTDREFGDYLCISQAIPGPNMILMMSFIGWQVWGFRERLPAPLRPSDRLARCTTPPIVCGIGSARRVGSRWSEWARSGNHRPRHRRRHSDGKHRRYRLGGTSVTVAAIVLMLRTRINPLWILLGGGILGGLGSL